MKAGSDGNSGLNKEYSKKLFGSIFYSWWNCSYGEREGPMIKGKVLTMIFRHRIPLLPETVIYSLLDAAFPIPVVQTSMLLYLT